ncbi:hypothetical protein MKW98_003295, partial [Papaver atlanticum]
SGLCRTAPVIWYKDTSMVLLIYSLNDYVHPKVVLKTFFCTDKFRSSEANRGA